MHTLRSHAFRNIANILNPSLFRQCYIGTKFLIQDYHKEVEACLDFISNHPNITHHRKLEFFSETRHAFGKTALVN
jgi:TAG lipase/steryl ester hydrolase/phospholipase A2/LPA acyltransferase